MTSTGKHSEPASARANSFPWPPVLFCALIAAAWTLGITMPIAWPGTGDLPARVIGLAFGIAGLVLVAWAIVTLMRAKTTVMPNGVSTALVTTGPYTRFRNPIYLGEVLLLLGVAELTWNIWFVAAAAAFAGLVTVLQILPEERHLSTQFGADFDAYRAHSRRWI